MQRVRIGERQSLCEFNTVANFTVMHQVNAVRLNVKEFHTQRFWADEVTQFLSIQEKRLTAVLKHLHTSSVDTSLMQRQNDSHHALVQSLIHTGCGYKAWRQLNIQYCGGSVAILREPQTHSVTNLGQSQPRRCNAQTIHSVAPDYSEV
eukprot:6047551-Amphidinium_carterae.1